MCDCGLVQYQQQTNQAGVNVSGALALFDVVTFLTGCAF